MASLDISKNYIGGHRASNGTLGALGFSLKCSSITNLDISSNHLKAKDMSAFVEQLQSKWKVDSAASQCDHCSKKFSLFRRKHHCRRCGGIFCNGCSQGRKLLAGSLKVVRVCRSCENAAPPMNQQHQVTVLKSLGMADNGGAISGELRSSCAARGIRLGE